MTPSASAARPAAPFPVAPGFAATGQAILAIDISAFGDVADFKARVDVLVRDLRASEKMPGVDRIWMPGEQTHHRRLGREAQGIPMPPALRASLDTLAGELGIERLP